MRMQIYCGLLTVSALTATCTAQTRAAALEHRWVYLATNLLVDKDVEDALALLERAGKAGYNGVVLTDSKFFRWDQLPERYVENVRRVRRACRDHKLACIACVCPIGYANDLLSRDPNLAEGLPVVDAPFVAKAVASSRPTILPAWSTAASSSRETTCPPAGASWISRARSRSSTRPSSSRAARRCGCRISGCRPAARPRPGLPDALGRVWTRTW